MKTLILCLLAMVCIGCSTAPIVIPTSQQYQAQIQPAPDPHKALVYFFANQQFESGAFSMTRGGRYAILNGGENGMEIAVLGCAPDYESRAIHHDCASYTWTYVTPGTYQLTAMFIDHHGTGESISAQLKAGTTSYFQVVSMAAAFSPDISLVPTDPDVAIRVMSEGYKFCGGLTCDIPSEDAYRQPGSG